MTTTVFNAAAYQQKVSQLSNYAARDGLSNDLEWRPAKLGHTVYEKTEEEPFVAVVIGKVADHKLKVGSSGNFITNYGTLAKAKFQLFLTPPITSALKSDFDRVFRLLSFLQDKAAVSQNKKDMLVKEGGSNMIRFTRNIFHEREKIAHDSPRPTKHVVVYDDDHEQTGTTDTIIDDNDQSSITSETDEMDEDTSNWKVPAELQADLDEIKPSYRAEPLRVYFNNLFVEPNEVSSAITNAIVEISFSIHHTYIKKENVRQDTFQAQIEQILILKKHIASSVSNPNPRDGPLQTHKPLTDVSKLTQSRAPKRAKTDDVAVAGPSTSTQEAKSSPKKIRIHPPKNTTKGKEKEKTSEVRDDQKDLGSE